MKLKNVVTATVVLTPLLLAGCGGGGGEPLLVAENFINHYYVQANVQEAKVLATPPTDEKIEAEFGLFAKSVSLENGKSHQVSYSLKEQFKEGKHAFYHYEITVTPKSGAPFWKEAKFSVDLVGNEWKITQFDDHTLDRPTETLR